MKKLLLLLAACVISGPALAQLRLGGSAEELLDPEKAFRISARALDERNVEVEFRIASGYYMYRDRFSFATESGKPLADVEIPRGKLKEDQFFGKQETFRDLVRIRVPLSPEDAAKGRVNLKVTSQGCADTGICYVPLEQIVRVNLPGARFGLATVDADQPPRSLSIYASDFEIARLFEGSLALVIASFVGFGLLLTFTPCVLPMIPILSGIIAGEGRDLNKLRALALSAAYVLGMAVTYAAAGVAAAYSGSLLAAALQNAWVLGAFALVFVGLALSMFGLYELRLPGFIHHRLHSAHQRLRGGQLASVAAMGAFSAVIVSPCVAAPFAGALLYISQTRDVALGGAALFAMALGMGVPLVAFGVSEGALLPRAGEWMNGVKKFFGVLLLAVAIYVISPVIPELLQMLAWAALLIGSGVFLRALDRLPADASDWWRLWKGAGVISLIAGVALLAGALAGSRDPLRPLAGIAAGGPAPAATATPWIRVASLTDLEEKLRAPGRPVMLDFYADWCVSCKEMEAFTFSDPQVRVKLDAMLLLQADVTDNTEQHKHLLKRFSLFGPPGIVFFDAQGRELKGLRVIGYQGPDRFLKTLSLVTEP